MFSPRKVSKWPRNKNYILCAPKQECGPSDTGQHISTHGVGKDGPLSRARLTWCHSPAQGLWQHHFPPRLWALSLVLRSLTCTQEPSPSSPYSPGHLLPPLSTSFFPGQINLLKMDSAIVFSVKISTSFPSPNILAALRLHQPSTPHSQLLAQGIHIFPSFLHFSMFSWTVFYSYNDSLRLLIPLDFPESLARISFSPTCSTFHYRLLAGNVFSAIL